MHLNERANLHLEARRVAVGDRRHEIGAQRGQLQTRSLQHRHPVQGIAPTRLLEAEFVCDNQEHLPPRTIVGACVQCSTPPAAQRRAAPAWRRK